MNKESQFKLKNRAIEMAKVPVQKKMASAIIDVISFNLSTETYCIESDFVREIFPMKDFTPLPGVPAHILGIINLRGQILAVINLKKFLNLPEKGLGELNKVIILNSGKMEFGILADVVHGTQTIDPEDIQNIPQAISGIGDEYLKGVTSDNLIILNAEKLLSDKKLIVKFE